VPPGRHLPELLLGDRVLTFFLKQYIKSNQKTQFSKWQDPYYEYYHT